MKEEAFTRSMRTIGRTRGVLRRGREECSGSRSSHFDIADVGRKSSGIGHFLEGMWGIIRFVVGLPGGIGKHDNLKAEVAAIEDRVFDAGIWRDAQHKHCLHVEIFQPIGQARSIKTGSCIFLGIGSLRNDHHTGRQDQVRMKLSAA